MFTLEDWHCHIRQEGVHTGQRVATKYVEGKDPTVSMQVEWCDRVHGTMYDPEDRFLQIDFKNTQEVSCTVPRAVMDWLRKGVTPPHTSTPAT